MPLLAVATIAHSNGLPEDAVQNSFAIQTGAASLSGADHDAIISAVIDFYTDLPTHPDRSSAAHNQALGAYLSNSLSRAGDGITVNLYDLAGALDGSPHGSPIRSGAGALPTAVSGGPLPAECALVLTLEALGRTNAQVEVGLTRPKSRYTGRLYLGPMQAAQNSPSGRPTPALQDVAISAAIDLDAKLRTINIELDLAVWSRADARVTAVEYVSVDDAWDTQRRRGVAATARRRVAVAEA